MEQRSPSLSTSAFNDYWNFISQKDLHDVLESHLSKIKPSLVGLFGMGGMGKTTLSRACYGALRRYPGLEGLRCSPLPGHFERLIFEAIEQCEVKDVKLVALSEEFFASIWPIVVSTVVLLSFVYLYYIGYIDRGGSKAGSSGSLDFRDIYISIVLFQAAYVWIKFRDVSPLPKGAVYQRRGSSKWEPRIKFPGGTSKRLPLGSCNNFAEAKVVYRIAAYYCNKHMHRLGRINFGGGAYFIPTFNVDPDWSYEEKVKRVGDQVLEVYEDFKEWKASRNLPPHISGLASEMSTGVGELLTIPPISQPQEPLNSGMDLTMQGQGSQPSPNIHNGVDFNNPSSGRLELLLLEANMEIDRLKAQLSRKEDECNVLKQRHSELEVLLEQSRPPDLDFDLDRVFDTIEA